jgi:hypothetical protein
MRYEQREGLIASRSGHGSQDRVAPPQDACSTNSARSDNPDSGSTPAGGGRRVGNLIIKDQPVREPPPEKDAEGFITLANGVRYRDHPRVTGFYEVQLRPGDKIFSTQRKPLPDDEVPP